MNPQKTTPAGQIALAGVLAAMAVAVMALGGLIPIATFVCPMMAMVLLQVVALQCGKRIGAAWYFAVAILSCLLSPDREAAGVFLFLGYYPLLKPRLDKSKLGLLWKAVLFNVSISVLYWLLLQVFGLVSLDEDFQEFGRWMWALLLVMGNVTFFLLDMVLTRLERIVVNHGRKH